MTRAARPSSPSRRIGKRPDGFAPAKTAPSGSRILGDYFSENVQQGWFWLNGLEWERYGARRNGNHRYFCFKLVGIYICLANLLLAFILY